MTRKSPPSKEKNSRKRKKMALGKGLEALIPGGLSAPSEDARDYLLCDVAIIKPNRYQPRRHFADEDMADLAASNLSLKVADAQKVLETLPLMDRLRLVHELLSREVALGEMQQDRAVVGRELVRSADRFLAVCRFSHYFQFFVQGQKHL